MKSACSGPWIDQRPARSLTDKHGEPASTPVHQGSPPQPGADVCNAHRVGRPEKGSDPDSVIYSRTLDIAGQVVLTEAYRPPRPPEAVVPYGENSYRSHHVTSGPQAAHLLATLVQDRLAHGNMQAVTEQLAGSRLQVQQGHFMLFSHRRWYAAAAHEWRGT